MSVQPVNGMIRNLPVIDLVVCLSGNGIGVNGLMRRPARHAFFGRPGQRYQGPFAIENMHGQDFLTEPIVIFRRPEMQFPDRRHIVPGVTNTVVPGRYLPVIAKGIIPITGLVRVSSGRQGRPRRAAQGAGTIGIGKPDTAMRDGVQIGCLHHGMTGRAQKFPGMIVGQKEYQVGWLRHVHRPYRLTAAIV